jgi:hypothetical protein
VLKITNENKVILSIKLISNINKSLWISGIISTIGHEVRFWGLEKWEKEFLSWINDDSTYRTFVMVI